MEDTFLKTIRESINHWYIPLIVGIIFLFTGIYTFFVPQESYLALSFLFSISFMVSGMAEIFFSVSNRNEMDNWGWTLTFGIITFILGLLLTINPGISMASLAFFIGFVVMFRSMMAISLSIDLDNYGVGGSAGLMFMGVLGFIFAFFLLWNPAFAGLTAVIWTGLALMTAGILGIIVAFRLKSLKSMPDSVPQELIDRYNAIRNEIRSARTNY